MYYTPYLKVVIFKIQLSCPSIEVSSLNFRFHLEIIEIIYNQKLQCLHNNKPIIIISMFVVYNVRLLLKIYKLFMKYGTVSMVSLTDMN